MDNLGRVLMMPCGEFSITKTYTRLDIVSHEGSAYICRRDAYGKAVTDTDYWMCIAEKGDPLTYESLTTAQKKDLLREVTSSANSAAASAQAVREMLESLTESGNVSQEIIAQVGLNTQRIEELQSAQEGFEQRMEDKRVYLSMDEYEALVESGGIIADVEYNVYDL